MSIVHKLHFGHVETVECRLQDALLKLPSVSEKIERLTLEIPSKLKDRSQTHQGPKVRMSQNVSILINHKSVAANT